MSDESKIHSTSLAPQFPVNVLIVDDNPDDAELCVRALRKEQFDVTYKVISKSAEFVEQLGAENFDVILCDYNLGPWNGVEALQILQRMDCEIPFILVTGALGEAKAVECFKHGLTDYVLKDRLERLPVAVFRALEESATRHEGRQAERQLRVSESMLRALSNAIPTAVFIEQRTQCRFVNHAAEEITGYTRAELLEKNLWELMLPSSRKALARHRANEGDDLDACSRYQARILTKAGDVRLLDVTVGAFRFDGGLSALISATDVTPRHAGRGTSVTESVEATLRIPRMDRIPLQGSGSVQRPH